jgi:hypothetical protein
MYYYSIVTAYRPRHSSNLKNSSKYEVQLRARLTALYKQWNIKALILVFSLFNFLNRMNTIRNDITYSPGIRRLLPAEFVRQTFVAIRVAQHDEKTVYA